MIISQNIFFKSQGKTPDEMELDLGDYDDEPNKKALVLLMHIKTMFETDERFRLDTISGRMNLYCKLLVHHFGREKINNLLDFASTVVSQGMFKALCAQNMLIPQTVEELQLRLKIMWGATTQVFTAAMECGKRQTGMVWNELGVNFDGTGVTSFFNMAKKRMMTHRKTPNHSDDVEFFNGCREISKMFYSRCGKVMSNFFCLSNTAPGMTYKLTENCENESVKIAVANAAMQFKYCNAYFQETLKTMVKSPNVLHANYIPTEMEQQTLVVEKDPLRRVWNLRRVFFEFFNEKATASDNPEFTKLSYSYRTEVMSLIKEWQSGLH